MSKLPYRRFFDVNVAVWKGGETEEYWIGQKEEREKWKDEEKVNEESDASGGRDLSLAPDLHTNAHIHTLTHT